ncbi:hypothetical protein [Sulfurospirillum halorespirans]|uniref:hypothetical protein n=1 Tax=Sulfurospirillum halorespirans TaxID=194424 RepID=UPI00084A1348|nr:hypothetical protein [Sulfurospirillum halorespirans]
MENEINTANIVTMLKEAANFSRDAKHIFEDLCLEFESKNLLKYDDSIRENFFFDKNKGALDYEFYVASNNNTIIGFRLIVAAEEIDGCGRYQDITEKLDIDKNIPLLLVYGCFMPVVSISQSLDNTVSMMSACIGLTSDEDEEYDWTNFDIQKIEKNIEILVESKEWTKEIEEKRDYPAWENYFIKAKIRYKPILEIQNHEDIKILADKIKAMTFETI